MIKHIVSWNRKAKVTDDDLLTIKTVLEALQGKIDGLLRIEVGLDVSRSDASADLVLYSEFVDCDALARYQVHSEHQAVIPLVQRYCCDRRVVDYHV